MAFTEILEASKNDAIFGLMALRRRGFASDYEAWANLKELIELTKNASADAEKLHKSMWAEIKDKDADAFAAMAQELERNAMANAAEWVRMAALADIAICPPPMMSAGSEAKRGDENDDDGE